MSCTFIVPSYLYMKIPLFKSILHSSSSLHSVLTCSFFISGPLAARSEKGVELEPELSDHVILCLPDSHFFYFVKCACSIVHRFVRWGSKTYLLCFPLLFGEVNAPDGHEADGNRPYKPTPSGPWTIGRR